MSISIGFLILEFSKLFSNCSWVRIVKLDMPLKNETTCLYKYTLHKLKHNTWCSEIIFEIQFSSSPILSSLSFISAPLIFHTEVWLSTLTCHEILVLILIYNCLDDFQCNFVFATSNQFDYNLLNLAPLKKFIINQMFWLKLSSLNKMQHCHLHKLSRNMGNFIWEMMFFSTKHEFK